MRHAFEHRMDVLTVKQSAREFCRDYRRALGHKPNIESLEPFLATINEIHEATLATRSKSARGRNQNVVLRDPPLSSCRHVRRSRPVASRVDLWRSTDRRAVGDRGKLREASQAGR